MKHWIGIAAMLALTIAVAIAVAGGLKSEPKTPSPSDSAISESMSLSLKLTLREAEVLYWVVKGKINRDIGDILGASPATVKKHLERIFAKFERGVAEGGGGMGLGLSICRAIVRLHGGRAWAERVAGGGIAFRFTLPLEEVPVVPAEALAT